MQRELQKRPTHVARPATLLSSHPTQYNVHSRDLQSNEETCICEKRTTKETYICGKRHATLLSAYSGQRTPHLGDLQSKKGDLLGCKETYKRDLHMWQETYNTLISSSKATHTTYKRPAVLKRPAYVQRDP